MCDEIIPPEELKIESVLPENYKAGGQHVGSYPCRIKVTHIPTGLVAISDVGISQFRNKEIAIEMILGGLTSKHLK